MSERDEPYRPTPRWDRTTVRHDPDATRHADPYSSPHGQPPADPDADPHAWRDDTTPGIAAVSHVPSYGPGPTYPAAPGSGYPASGAGYPGDSHQEGGHAIGQGVPVTAPEYSDRPVAVRRPDVVAALLFLLAGIAAATSLVMRWVHGDAVTGWGLMRRAFNDLVQMGPGEVFRSGLWQPVAMVLAGGLLFLLGLLMLVPARSHRVLGVLALLITLGAAAGVLVAISQPTWQLSRFDTGFWLAVGAVVLGFVGSLKAMLSGPRLRGRGAGA
jgi:hypothetical protein